MSTDLPRKIGLISPGSPGGGGIKNPEEEMRDYIPAGFELTTRLVELFDMTPEGIEKFSKTIDQAAVELAAQHVELIVFCCTSGSFIGGLGYDKQVSDRLTALTGIPAITTTTSILKALDHLKAKKLVLATPYVDKINQIEHDFLAGNGYEVLRMKGLAILDTPRVPQVPIEEIEGLVKDVLVPEADTIFISCAGLKVLKQIDRLEKEFGRKIITSNQCTLWGIFQALGIDAQPPLGQLFTK